MNLQKRGDATFFSQKLNTLGFRDGESLHPRGEQWPGWSHSEDGVLCCKSGFSVGIKGCGDRCIGM